MKLITLNKTDYIISKTMEYIEFFVYCGATLVIPFLIWWPQWLVWSLVNTFLVLAALNLKNAKLLPIIILPSLWVLSRGLIFGSFTVFLLYMIPFIWIGNALLVTSMKLKYKKQINLTIGIMSKVLFLFLVTILLIKFNILPAVFAKSMWVVQLYTAIVGWILALSIQYIKKNIIIGLKK